MTPASTTTLTCADGRNFDLLNPQVEDISFLVICEHLAKANRYAGATPGRVYSVAQHSSLCAKAALITTGNYEVAGYLLCHDMHEAYLGDDVTPKKRALAAIMQRFGVLHGAIAQAFDMLTDRIDRAIHAAAGLAWPPTPEIAEQIHRIDRMMLATEWRDLMRNDLPIPQPYPFPEPPLPDEVVPHEHWQTSAREMFSLCRSLLPAVMP
jgi:hypothetical protein